MILSLGYLFRVQRGAPRVRQGRLKRMDLAIKATTYAPRRSGSGRWRGGRPCLLRRGSIPRRGRGILQVREPAARRGVQDPRRGQSDPVAAGSGARARSGGVLLGESRAGDGDRGEARRGAGDHRHARGCAALEDGGDARAGRQDRHLQPLHAKAARQLPSAILKDSGATLVPPFDHPMIMAGQGTAALELLDETGPLDALITPVGGGGLLSGCARSQRR